MIFIFNESERNVTRKKATGFSSVEIAEDVHSGDSISIGWSDGTMKISKAEDDTSESPELFFLTKEIGLFSGNKGLKSNVEIIPCDDCFFVQLIEGAVMMSVEGEVMTVYRNIDPATIPASTAEEVKWVSVDNILPFCKCWLKDNAMFAEDFIYSLEVSGYKEVYNYIFDMKLLSTPVDISCGNVEKKAEERAVKARIVEAKRVAKELEISRSVTSSFSDFGDEDEQFEDDVQDDEDYEEEDW